jgi:hypothetical protein
MCRVMRTNTTIRLVTTRIMCRECTLEAMPTISRGSSIMEGGLTTWSRRSSICNSNEISMVKRYGLRETHPSKVGTTTAIRIIMVM